MSTKVCNYTLPSFTYTLTLNTMICPIISNVIHCLLIQHNILHNYITLYFNVIHYTQCTYIILLHNTTLPFNTISFDSHNKMKGFVRTAKNITKVFDSLIPRSNLMKIKGYTDVQITCRDATSNDPAISALHILQSISDATYQQSTFLEAFYIIDKRLNDHGKVMSLSSIHYSMISLSTYDSYSSYIQTPLQLLEFAELETCLQGTHCTRILATAWCRRMRHVYKRKYTCEL